MALYGIFKQVKDVHKYYKLCIPDMVCVYIPSVCVNIYSADVHACMRTCVYIVCLHAHAYMCVCTRLCVYEVCVYTYLCICNVCECTVCKVCVFVCMHVHV